MDPKHRVYYLVNLNQNRKMGGWCYPGWDNYGIRYKHNLGELRRSIVSLKTRYRPFNYHSIENYQVLISCKKEEESELTRVLSKLHSVDYIKVDPTNKEKFMANAKKCDRCGKFYEKNYEKGKHGYALVGVCFVDTRDQSVGDKDLCDECIIKFRKFMAGCELKEE